MEENSTTKLTSTSDTDLSTAAMSTSTDNTLDSVADITTSTETASDLPDIPDDQLLKVLEARKDFKIPVKIDGKEELLPFDEYRSRVSHQSVASRELNEGKELKKKYETAMNELKTYAQGTKEQKLELMKAFGLDPASLYEERQKEDERLSEMTDEERKFHDLEKYTKTLEAKLNDFQSQYETNESANLERQLQQEFDVVAKEYPAMESKDLQRYAAFLMSNDLNLKTRDAFKMVSEMIEGTVKTKFNDYIQGKKTQATTATLPGASRAGTSFKDLSKIGSPLKRLEALYKS